MTREAALYNTWKTRLVSDRAFSAELAAIEGDEQEIRDRFYTDLTFGTAGLRGVLGLGSNRMNIFTVRRATQGLAMYLLDTYESPSAAIAYDSRIQSDEFARETACVFAANGIAVHLYQELMPTPALSYAVRELGCQTGVVITASHNPAKYNGYKAYDPTGCQIGPEVAEVVLKNISALDYFEGIRCMDFDKGLRDGVIRYIPESFVQRYIDRVCAESLNPGVPERAGLKLVYTPLNGAGRRCVLEVLERQGVKDIVVVPEQAEPDGRFPTCPYPNPEMREALKLGLALCEKTGADLLLATDPDADRVAVAARDGGEYRIITGNEAGVLLLDYIASTRKKLGTMPARPVAVKSIVSSKLADAVAAEHGVEILNVLTGFKFIGEAIAALEQKGEQDRFLLGFEESCGYLSGGYVRDKDAVDASLLLVEMASAYKLEGKSLFDVLRDIYGRHGIYRNAVDSFSFEGADGMAKMADIMRALRRNPPADIAGSKVVYRADYHTSARWENGMETAIPLPSSNVLEYGLADGCAVIVRPSGTEPKIKIYYSLVGKSQQEVATLAAGYKTACEALVGV